MNVIEAIRNRKSIRDYTNQPISEKDIEQLIDSARMAPSAGNTQPWEFVIVKDQQRKSKISLAALNQAFIMKAPVVIVVCTDENRSSRIYGERGKKLYCIQDTAAAIENLILTAQELGLATCWVGAFIEKEVAKTIKTPKNVRPIAIIPIGYPAGKTTPTYRRPIKEVIHYETFY